VSPQRIREDELEPARLLLAGERAPEPIASVKTSSGRIRLKSSASRNPGPVVMSPPIESSDFRAGGYCCTSRSKPEKPLTDG
jgi:hypothetical protein